MNATLSLSSTGIKPKATAITGNVMPSKWLIDKEISRMKTSEPDGYEDWTEADFKADLRRAGAKIRVAAREAHEDLLAGRTEPFPEP